MKMLFLLHLLLCQWVVSFSDKDCNIGGKYVGNTDSEIFFSLTGNELPFTIHWLTVDYTNVKIVNFATFNKTHLKIGSPIGDNAHITVNASLFRERISYSILFVISERVVFVVDYRIRPCLSEAGHGHHDESKCEKQSFHAANIEKI